MAKETTDKKESKSVRHGIPMSPEALADYEKTWTDMDECIAFCESHAEKPAKKKSKK